MEKAKIITNGNTNLQWVEYKTADTMLAFAEWCYENNWQKYKGVDAWCKDGKHWSELGTCTGHGLINIFMNELNKNG